MFSKAMKHEQQAMMAASNWYPRWHSIPLIRTNLDVPAPSPVFLSEAIAAACWASSASASWGFTTRHLGEWARRPGSSGFRRTCVTKAQEQSSSGPEPKAIDCHPNTAKRLPNPMRAAMVPHLENVAKFEKQEAHSSFLKRPSMILQPQSQPPELQKARAPRIKESLACPSAKLKAAAAAAAAKRATFKKGFTPTTSMVMPLQSLPKARMREPAAKAELMLELSKPSLGSSAKAPSSAMGMEKANISVNCGMQ
mmetsp:Transcript_32767/g.92434  ORF Transcript_32767/g.92434 Transcript_32767/m.92434 type:complete len:253 (+) Transcript_32767:746-1504(+)